MRRSLLTTLLCFSLLAPLCWLTPVAYAAVVAYDTEVAADSPWHYWKVQETSGTSIADTSGNSRTGTLTLSSGMLGAAVSELPVDPALKSLTTGGNGSTGGATITSAATFTMGSGGMSAEMWVTPSTINTSGGANLISTSSYSAGNGGFQLRIIVGGKIRFNASANGADAGTTDANSIALVAGTRYHVAVTFDLVTGVVVLYVNGQSVTFTFVAPKSAATQTAQAIIVGDAKLGMNLSHIASYTTVLSRSRLMRHRKAGVGMDSGAGVTVPFYAGPSATNYDALGTTADPLPLYTLSSYNALIESGTIYMKGGTYASVQTNRFLVKTVGTASNRITWTNVPGEHVTFSNTSASAISPYGNAVFEFSTTSAYTDLIGNGSLSAGGIKSIEFEWAGTTRTSTSGGALPLSGIDNRSDCVVLNGNSNRVINVTAHDCTNGIGTHGGLENHQNTSVHGAILWGHGWYDASYANLGLGNGLYTANHKPSVIYLNDTVSFNNFYEGIQGYSNYAYVQNYYVNHWIGFNNGSPTAVLAGDTNFRGSNLDFDTATASEYGTGSPPELAHQNINITNSHFYYPPSQNKATNAGFGLTGIYNQDVTFTGNRLTGGKRSVQFARWTQVTATGNWMWNIGSPTGSKLVEIELGSTDPNNVAATKVSHGAWTVNSNTYFDTSGAPLVFQEFLAASSPQYNFVNWQIATGYDAGSTYSTSAPASTDEVFVYPQDTSISPLVPAGRSLVVVYNRDGNSTASVNLSLTGLINGQEYEIRDVECYLDQACIVSSGNYNSSSPTVSVNMSDTARITQPLGITGIASMKPAFGVFIILPGAQSIVGVPTAPSSMTVNLGTSTGVTWTWVCNSNTGTNDDTGMIFGYQYSSDIGQSWSTLVEETLAAHATTKTLVPPAAKVLYRGYVRATNAAGDSLNAGPVQSYTPVVIGYCAGGPFCPR